MNHNLELHQQRDQRLGTLVLGLGNSIFRDDGVGVHAIRRFQQLAPCPCSAVEVGTAIFDAMHLMEKADRIIAFDAIKAGGKPGSVYILRAEEAEDPAIHTSVHEIGLIQILKMFPRAKAEVIIIGAEPQIIDWGEQLSPAVEAAVPIMVSTARNIVLQIAPSGI